jgi:hypothetical protein
VADRSEVCKLANELSRQRGGKPYEYMGEAWETLRKKEGLSTKREPIKRRKTDEDEKRSVQNSSRVQRLRERDIDGFYRNNEDQRERVHKKVQGVASRLRGVVFGTGRMAKNTSMRVGEHVNFMKAPKDNPKVLTDFVRLDKVDPIPKIPDSVKKIFKFW